jgi:hypothetical protein
VPKLLCSSEVIKFNHSWSSVAFERPVSWRESQFRFLVRQILYDRRALGQCLAVVQRQRRYLSLRIHRGIIGTAFRLLAFEIHLLQISIDPGLAQDDMRCRRAGAGRKNTASWPNSFSVTTVLPPTIRFRSQTVGYGKLLLSVAEMPRGYRSYRTAIPMESPLPLTCKRSTGTGYSVIRAENPPSPRLWECSANHRK